ncbi:MAG: choice-of-anchor Q domain-containing protein [Planctomycetota bacterium]
MPHCNVSRSLSNQAVSFVLALSASIGVRAEILTVNQDGSTPFSTIHEAAAAAQDGDVIVLRPGEYVLDRPVRLGLVTICGVEGQQVTHVRMGTPANTSESSVFWSDRDERFGTILFESVTISGGRGTSVDGETHGGAVYCPNVNTRFTDCVLKGNAVSGDGGAVFSKTITVFRSRLEGNYAGGRGGGIAGRDTSFTQSQLVGNRARAGGAFATRGGVRSSVNANATLFANNRAETEGGAIAFQGTSDSLQMKNCVLYGNAAGSSGGALFARGEIQHCTFSSNFAPRYGAIDVRSGSSIRLRSCIVVGHGEEPVSRFSATTCIFDVKTNDTSHVIVADPRFVAAGSFEFGATSPSEVGGRMIDMPSHIVEAPDLHLKDDSPAIDAADSFESVDFDQNSRTCGFGPDIGAFEANVCVEPVFLRGDYNATATLDISDAISGLQFLKLGGAQPGCMDAADSNDDGRIDISDAINTLNYLFLGGEPPPAPGAQVCGIDTTEDLLGCSTEACP